MKWETFCRRTEDPKLSFIEMLLDLAGIEHRREGESFHAPILQVDADRIDDAWKLLDTKVEGVSFDDLPDDHPIF